MSTNAWAPTPIGFQCAAGGLALAVTDQSDRDCGWCWHVSLAEPDHNGAMGEIARGGGKENAAAAKLAAEQYARDFCARTLAAITEEDIMDSFDANMYRDLSDNEIIALAEQSVVLSVDEQGKWSWTKRGAILPSFNQPAFSTKIGAADDAVCTLGLDHHYA